VSECDWSITCPATEHIEGCLSATLGPPLPEPEPVLGIVLTDRCERCGGPYEFQYEATPGEVQYLCRKCVQAKLDAVLDRR
jgi:hypothetical protein